MMVTMRSLLIFMVVAVGILSPSCMTFADENKTIRRHKINIGKLRKSIESHQGKINVSNLQEKSILQELEDIDKRLDRQLKKILAIQTQIDQQEVIILAKQFELAAIDLEKQELQEHLVNRLRAFYHTGKTTLLDVTFSNKNLPDILLFDDAFHRLVTYDKKIFESYRAQKQKIKDVKRAHELERTVQLGFLQRADEEKKALHQIAEEKNELLARTKSQKFLYSQALKEMKRAETDLTSTIKDLKIKQQEKSRGFLLNKGKLGIPAPGTLFLSFESDSEQNNIQLSQGISIKTNPGEEVSSVYNGKVIYADYMRGYGKTVIIDHGLQYYTITSRLDSIDVKKGQKVATGQRIGNTGDIATLFGRGLYFEIRHGSTPENPMTWFGQEAYSSNQ